MTQERLNALLFLFIEQELTCNVNIEVVIDEFKNVPIKKDLFLIVLSYCLKLKCIYFIFMF